MVCRAATSCQVDVQPVEVEAGVEPEESPPVPESQHGEDALEDLGDVPMEDAEDTPMDVSEMLHDETMSLAEWSALGSPPECLVQLSLSEGGAEARCVSEVG